MSASVCCRWCPAGTHLVITTIEKSTTEKPAHYPVMEYRLERYSTFGGLHCTERLASFTSTVGTLMAVTSAAETMFFRTGGTSGLLITDRSGTTVARHAVAFCQIYDEPHLSRDGRLLLLSHDRTALIVSSAAGALHSVKLCDRPSIPGCQSGFLQACSSWEGLGIVFNVLLDTIYMVDLSADSLRPVMQAKLAATPHPALVQGRRSVACVTRDGLRQKTTVLSTSHGSVLFRVSGQAACWDVPGDHCGSCRARQAATDCVYVWRCYQEFAGHPGACSLCPDLTSRRSSCTGCQAALAWRTRCSWILLSSQILTMTTAVAMSTYLSLS